MAISGPVHQGGIGDGRTASWWLHLQSPRPIASGPLSALRGSQRYGFRLHLPLLFQSGWLPSKLPLLRATRQVADTSIKRNKRVEAPRGAVLQRCGASLGPSHPMVVVPSINHQLRGVVGGHYVRQGWLPSKSQPLTVQQSPECRTGAYEYEYNAPKAGVNASRGSSYGI